MLMSDMKEYSLDEAAKALGKHPNTITRHIDKGTLEASKRGGRWYITEQALEAWRRGTKPPAGKIDTKALERTLRRLISQAQDALEDLEQMKKGRE